ncbi:MAG TPA: hypothetical protein VMM12_13180 [Longimicrobiales bacterium]|nr:hypothetical protein [Longimicrobiales bacterium]
MLVRIHVSYSLRTPAGSRAEVERALARHAARCPTALSLKGAIEVTWHAQVDEAGERWEMKGSRDD